jgi:hypothetical protein
LIALVIFVLAAIVLAWLWMSTKITISRLGKKVTKGDAIIGELESPRPFPGTVDKPVIVRYKVVKRAYTQTGFGSPVITGPSQDVKFANVTFSLDRGDASVNGTQQVVVRTDKTGIAQVTLKPEKKNGQDVLSFELEYQNSKIADDEKFPFEVTKKP